MVCLHSECSGCLPSRTYRAKAGVLDHHLIHPFSLSSLPQPHGAQGCSLRISGLLPPPSLCPCCPFLLQHSCPSHLHGLSPPILREGNLLQCHLFSDTFLDLPNFSLKQVLRAPELPTRFSALFAPPWPCSRFYLFVYCPPLLNRTLVCCAPWDPQQLPVVQELMPPSLRSWLKCHLFREHPPHYLK